MFHLFDKVYLTFDHNISAMENRMVFSEAMGDGDGSADNGKLKLYSHHLEDLVGEGKQFQSYLDLIKHFKFESRHGKLMIYCDTTAFKKLFIAWHKSIISNPTKDSIWHTLMLYLQKESFLSSITDEVHHVHFDKLHPSKWDRKEFDKIYKTVEVTPDTAWNASIIQSLGIEYLISSYLRNKGNELVKEVLKNKIRVLANRVLQDELYDTRISIINNSFSPELHSIFDIDYNNGINIDIFDNQSLGIFNDPLVWRNGMRLTASSSSGALDLASTPLEKLNLMIDTAKKFRIEFQGCSSSSMIVRKLDWSQWVVGDFNDEDIESLLESDGMSSSELIADGDKRQVNFLLIDWFINQYKLHGKKVLLNFEIKL